MADHYRKIVGIIADICLQTGSWEKAIEWLQGNTDYNIEKCREVIGDALQELLAKGLAKKVQGIASENTPEEILLKIANYYTDKLDWENALPWHERIYRESEKYRKVAFGNMVTCLLELGKAYEAESRISHADCPAEGTMAAFHCYMKWGIMRRRRSGMVSQIVK